MTDDQRSATTTVQPTTVPRGTRDLDRCAGALLGLAVGDALGTTLEFTPPGHTGPPRVTDMVGGGPFNLAPGQWTDDTSMALCLAESLLEHHILNPPDVLERWVRWWRHGENSSTGRCFDIGSATLSGLARFEHDGSLWARDLAAAGNGTLMRLAPIAIACPERRAASAAAMMQSYLTHGADEAADACSAVAAMMVDAIGGAPKKYLLRPEAAAIAATERIRKVLAGSYRKGKMGIKPGGYVVDTLEAALWAFWSTETFEWGALAAVNLGGDSDTIGAVYGQIAGAHYGASAIPAHWLELLHDGARIRQLAVDLASAIP